MTRHVSEDTILQLALGLLDAQEEESVRRHLGGCPACHELLKDVERTLKEITEVRPQVNADIPPLPSSGHMRYRWLRMAAMLAVGFGLGFIVSHSLHAPSLDVVPQQIVPRSPDWAPSGFVACDEIDLTWKER